MSLHEVYGVSGRRYERWIEAVTYKPGWELTVSDQLAYRYALAHADPHQGTVLDVPVNLRLDFWVEDSTRAWPQATREAYLAQARVLGRQVAEVVPIAEVRPLLGRQLVHVAMARELPAGIMSFSGFLAEVREAIRVAETHEADEWLKVSYPDATLVPFNPHSDSAAQSAVLAQLDRRERARAVYETKVAGSRDRLDLVTLP